MLECDDLHVEETMQLLSKVGKEVANADMVMVAWNATEKTMEVYVWRGKNFLRIPTDIEDFMENLSDNMILIRQTLDKLDTRKKILKP